MVGTSSSLSGCLSNDQTISTYADSSDWRFAYHDTGHSGYNPAASGITDEPQIRFERSIADGSDRYRYDLPPTPIVVDGVLYIGGDGVHAIDTDDGRTLWHVDEDTSYHGSAMVGGTVYITSRSGTRNDGTSFVHAVDADSGQEQWQTEITADNRPGPYPPIVAGSTVYGHAESGVVQALSSDDGATEWTVDGWGSLNISPIVTFDTETLYHYEERIKARESGQSGIRTLLRQPPAVIWEQSPPGSTSGWLTVRNETLYAPGEASAHRYNDGQMSAHGTDGSEKWTYDIGARSSPPAIAGESLYIVTLRADGRIGHNYRYEPTVVALDATDGTERWTQTLEDPRPTDAQPIVTDDVVYIGNVGKEVHAFDTESGEQRWSYTLDSPVRSLATVGNDLYVVTAAGMLYALSS
ncbi:MAG: PQQ-binding-like beta-propeller repeat protein [Euryarchaeota archaeon]|nr:PQQ-binding-like beta-propeller repeat protein [Euryarchaeota archaeon]